MRSARHLGGRAWTGPEVSLGRQLRVDLDDGAAGKPELCGEGTRGRQRLARGEASTPDGLSQSGFERRTPAPTRGKFEVQVHSGIATGPRIRHRIGPYRWAGGVDSVNTGCLVQRGDDG
ncbi:transcriptional regulator, GntR family with aminotransferase domain protein [Mycobacterium intracellulare MIN_061107_1834]|nr:transcriptional regulator, GntR family with aminotransferase domain protein [Mycobacterium intracellulare MIN_061107_1834]